MSGILEKAWGYLNKANNYWTSKTHPIKDEGSASDKLQALQNYLKLDEKEKQALQELYQQSDGEDFIARKVEDINRYASHRTAFIGNAIVHFIMVNLSSIALLSFIPSTWFKILLVAANLFVAFIAWRRIRSSKSHLLNGPSEEPGWSFWGMFSSNRRKYNEHIKDQAHVYKVRMHDERLFMIMYAINAVTIFFASQLILTDHLPVVLSGIINTPLFILSIPFALANAYWAFISNNQVVRAATERGSKLDKLKL